MNIVLDDCEEIVSSAQGGGQGEERRKIGKSMIRGNSVISMEVLQRL